MPAVAAPHAPEARGPVAIPGAPGPVALPPPSTLRNLSMGGPSGPAPSPGMVALQAPDGTIQRVPAGEADHYVQQGAQRV